MWISDIKHDGKAQGSVSQKSPETLCKCEAILALLYIKTDGAYA